MDLGIAAVETAMSAIKFAFSPLGALFHSPGGHSPSEAHYVPDSNDPLEQQDRGYAMADRLVPVIHGLAQLLTFGPDEFAGVDWERLSGRSGQHILTQIRDFERQFVKEPTAVSMQVRTAAKPVGEVLRSAQQPPTNVSELMCTLGRPRNPESHQGRNECEF